MSGATAPSAAREGSRPTVSVDGTGLDVLEQRTRLLGAADADADTDSWAVEEQATDGSTPLWAWSLLVAAVLAVSSAGTAFALMKDVPPLTLAAWRLQLTSVLLGIGAAVELRGMGGERRRRVARSAPWLAASGTALAVHFGCWVASVERTSLTHSLLFVSATPVLLAAGACALRMPISRGELAGTAVGVVGTALLAAGATSEKGVTLGGDAAALAASAAIIPYLLVGRRLRQWMPLFVYAASVTGLAALELTVAGAAEGSRAIVPGAHGLFGWVASPRYLPLVVYLAVVPGIVGHTGFNALLRYLDPLVIALALNLEPLLGSVLGFLLGVSVAPGALTYAGGALVMLSTGAVTLASHRRQADERSRRAAAAKVRRAMEAPLDEL